MQVFVRVLWAFTLVSCGIGGLVLLTGLVGASGAPQEAAAGAIACALAVIPYCATRAIAEATRPSEVD